MPTGVPGDYSMIQRSAQALRCPSAVSRVERARSSTTN
jgi:hypothetical protein